MCAEVYGVVFDDPTPKKNGRRGQKQGGVDVFVDAQDGRIGIQCKRYATGRLTFEHVKAEVEAADKAGTAITRLILATTADNDAALTKKVQEYSDERSRHGKFLVEIEFWGDITNRINEHPVLQEKYSPNAPGGVFHRLAVQGDQSHTAIQQMSADVQQLIALVKKQSSLGDDVMLPTARPDSANRLITQQLDHINTLIKSTRYREAMSMIEAIGQDMEPFDAHQKARWHVQRGVCTTHLVGADAGFKDMLAGAEIYPDDDRMAAAKIRGLILKGEKVVAVVAGQAALHRFPMSVSVWLAATQARTLNGEIVTEKDMPPQFANDAEVLQVLSWAATVRNDYPAALDFGLRAIGIPSAGFFPKSAALMAALSLATQDPVARSYGMIDPSVTDALRRIVQSFEPRAEYFWANQSAVVLPDETANLAYAYVLLNEPETALRILDESAAHFAETPRMLSVRLEALRAQKKEAEFLLLAGREIDRIEPEAFMLVAEVAANSGDTKTLKAIIDRMSAAGGNVDELKSLHWLALCQAGSIDQAIAAIDATDLQTVTSPIVLMNGIRVLLASDRREEAEGLLDRAAGMVPQTAPVELRMFLADLLYAAKRFVEAARIFEAYAPDDRFSELHKRLLRAYIRSGQRMRARQLLDRFPGRWSEDDETRSLAIELANLAGDWSRMLPLAEKEVEVAPSRAASWLLRLYVEMRAKPIASVMELLAKVPDNLQGSHRQILQTAAAEMRFGQVRKGMVRLYCLMRSNMDVPEVTEGFLVCILMHSGELPWMENQLPAVTPGASVVLESAHGQTTEISIDPEEAGELPQHSSFLNAADKQAAPLLGHKVGDEIEIVAGLGVTQRLKIVSISTAYRRLLNIAQEYAHRAFGGLPNIASVPIVKKDGELDLEQMHQMLKKRREHVEMVFATYQEQPATLGIVATALGVSPVDLVLEWPTGEDKPLHVFDGSHTVRLRAEQALAAPDAAAVIDIATLTELVHLRCEAALAAIPKVYVSAALKNALAELRRETESDRSMGTAVDVDGRLEIHEITDAHRRHRIDLLDRLQAAIDAHCEVCPSYGGHEIADSIAKLTGILGDDEYEAVLLAHERKTILLSMDYRLRAFATEAADIPGAWPQILLANAVAKQKISLNQYFSACATQLRGQRTNIWLNGELVLWMATQGHVELQDTVARIRKYLTAPTANPAAGVELLIDFLHRLCTRSTSPSVLRVLIEEFGEAICRHQRFNDFNFEQLRNGVDSMVSVVGTADSGINAYDQANVQFRQRLFRYLDQGLLSARERAQQPQKIRPSPLALMCVTKLPSIVFRAVPVIET